MAKRKKKATTHHRRTRIKKLEGKSWYTPAEKAAHSRMQDLAGRITLKQYELLVAHGEDPETIRQWTAHRANQRLKKLEVETNRIAVVPTGKQGGKKSKKRRGGRKITNSDKPGEIDTDLAINQVIEAWPKLSEQQRLAVLDLTSSLLVKTG